ncbi:DUF7162 family protein [Mycolicibacterium vaccae]|uniref:DUF7162 family protein n=1 Tax=Mycolicibacterium vaccae TaxID=1810 RepID=UPI003CFE7F62
MTEISRIEFDRLRHLAARVDDAADRLAAYVWPQLEPSALPGSAVAVAAAQPVAVHTEQLAADLRGWASVARATARAFAHADTASGDRISRP